SYLSFTGLSWAYTYEALPTMEDGHTPGYADIGSGQNWIDSSWPYWNNIIGAAVELSGAQRCTFTRCRIGHTGGSGVVIGPYPDGAQYVESDFCTLDTCEIFDIGGHGVYIGDERSRDDHSWALSGQAASKDPSYWDLVERCKIQNFAVS